MQVRFLVLRMSTATGGVRSVVNQANALAGHHDVQIVTLFSNFSRLPFELDPRVRRRRLVASPKSPIKKGMLKYLARLPSKYVPKEDSRYPQFSRATDVILRRYLENQRAGVLITTRPALSVMVARLGSPSVVKIGQDHMNHRSYSAGLAAEIKRWYPKLDAVVTLTKADAREYAETLGPEARVLSVPNLVPAPDTEPASLDSKIVIAAGRLTPQKGFDMLIDAFAKVVVNHPDWQLRIFGKGSHEERLRAKIERTGMTRHVHLMGTTLTLDQEMRASAMYVLSSRYEGLPMTVLESMRQGIPVVAFDCHTGPAEIITDDEDGLLVPPRDVGALAASIEELIVDPARRRRLGAAAQQSVERFSAESVRLQWEKVYADLGAT